MQDVPWIPLPFTKRLRVENIRRITGCLENERDGVNAMFPPDLLRGLERRHDRYRVGRLILTVDHERPAAVRFICLRAMTTSGLYVDTCCPSGPYPLEMDISGAVTLCKYLSKRGNRLEYRNNEITLHTKWDYVRTPTPTFSAEFVRTMDGARYTLGTFDFPR